MTKIEQIFNLLPPVKDKKESQSTGSWYFTLNGKNFRLSDHESKDFEGFSVIIKPEESYRDVADKVLLSSFSIPRKSTKPLPKSIIKTLQSYELKIAKLKAELLKKDEVLKEMKSDLNILSNLKKDFTFEKKYKDLKRDYDTLFDEYDSFKRSSEIEMDELDKECDEWNSDYILAKSFIDTIKKSWIVKFYCLFDKQMKRQLKFYNKNA